MSKKSCWQAWSSISNWTEQFLAYLGLQWQYYYMRLYNQGLAHVKIIHKHCKLQTSYFFLKLKRVCNLQWHTSFLYKWYHWHMPVYRVWLPAIIKYKRLQSGVPIDLKFS